VPLLDAVRGSVPLAEHEDATVVAARQQGACTLYAAMRPRDAVEAALAARAVAAHHAAMDMYARAGQPGTANDAVIRLRAGAIAASRSFDATLRVLQLRQAQPLDAQVNVPPVSPAHSAVVLMRAEEATPPAEAPADKPQPLPEAGPSAAPGHQPKGWFRGPIPTLAVEPVTMVRHSAASTAPYDIAGQGAAMAEEAAAIAEAPADEAVMLTAPMQEAAETVECLAPR
jgi:hypothetical protein